MALLPNPILRLTHYKNGLVFASQGLASGATLIIALVLTRHLGLHGFGAFSVVWLLGQLAQQVQHALFVAPMLSMLPARQGQAAHALETGIFTWGHTFAALCGVLTFALLHLPFLPQLASWVPQARAGTGLCITLLLLHDLTRRRAYAKGQAQRVLLQDVATYTIQGLALSLAIATHQLTPTTVWWCFAAGYGAGLFVIRLWYGVIWLAPNYSRAVLGQLWQYSRWLLAAQTMQWWAGNYYLVLAGTLLGAEALGALRMCQTVMGVLHVLLQALENLVPVKAAALLSRKGQQAFARYIKKVLVQVLAVAALFVMAIAGAGTYLLQVLFGAAATTHGSLLFWLAAMYLLVGAGTVFRFALRTKAVNAPTFWGYTLSAGLAWLLAPQLIQTYGAYGAMMGLWANQAVMLLVLLPAFYRVLANRPPLKGPLQLARYTYNKLLANQH